MKKIAYIFIMAFAFSCEKREDDVDPRECFQENTGNIYVDNKTTNNYDVYVNGKLTGIVAANDRILVTVRYDDKIPVKVVQRDGYIFVKKEFASMIDVKVCGESLFRFQD